ncbi:hypothetical protein [Hymenobacter negativus]|uniref:DUF3592 domain-containing protein n=1 Tax=Hymenobacter negativus TaxID=2795026 RepID=A0ABS3QGV3_9BACT|nr:hypothetical protein [Hymenobacter negativus]MBO2010471.1 hypothetical protein [Hymenobacter negativus]
MKSFLLALLLASPSMTWAQNAPTDIILRTDGSEVVGRVLTISPVTVSYLPPASADTLRLAAADVFLVRYANGTREVLHPIAPVAGPDKDDLLPGMSDLQRRVQGRQDAARYYTNQAPFWGSLGATLYTGPLLGLIAPAVITTPAVATRNLHAPHPELLADPAYSNAYREEAHRRKRGRAWGGYGVGAGVWVVLIGALVASVP